MIDKSICVWANPPFGIQHYLRLVNCHDWVRVYNSHWDLPVLLAFASSTLQFCWLRAGMRCAGAVFTVCFARLGVSPVLTEKTKLFWKQQTI